MPYSTVPGYVEVQCLRDGINAPSFLGTSIPADLLGFVRVLFVKREVSVEQDRKVREKILNTISSDCNFGT